MDQLYSSSIFAYIVRGYIYFVIHISSTIIVIWNSRLVFFGFHIISSGNFMAEQNFYLLSQYNIVSLGFSRCTTCKHLLLDTIHSIIKNSKFSAT